MKTILLLVAISLSASASFACSFEDALKAAKKATNELGKSVNGAQYAVSGEIGMPGEAGHKFAFDITTVDRNDVLGVISVSDEKCFVSVIHSNSIDRYFVQ